MAKLKKSTVKFQKHHLKQEIERRKKHKKVQQAYKRRIDSRNNGTRPGADRSNDGENAAKEESEQTKKPGVPDISKININDFMQVDCLLGDEDALELNDDKESDLDILDKFKGVEDIALPEQVEDEDEESDAEMDELDDGSITVTKEMLQEWIKKLEKSPKINSLKEMLLTFRAMSLMDEKYNATCRYQVNSETVFMKILATVLDTAPLLINANLVAKKVGSPASAPKWSELQPVTRLYCNSLLRILHDVADDELYQVLLEQLDSLVTYIAIFPQARKAYVKILLKLWSTPAISSSVRQQCMSNLCNMASVPINDKATGKKSTMLGYVLKCVYITYARRAQQVDAESAVAIEEMRTSSVKVYRANDKHSLHHALVYIQLLTQYLQTATKSQTKDTVKVVLSWQYLNCLKFWSKVVGTICGANAQDGSKPSQLAEAIYPLVEISIGLIKLMPSVQFLPLRFHLIRMLVDLGKQTGTYIPLAPYLFELFNIDEIRKKAKSVSMPPLEFDLIIKAPKEYLHGKVYQDELLSQLHSCLIEYYACYGLSIAFPELAVTAIVELTAQEKRAKNPKFMRQLHTLKEKLEEQTRYIQQQRSAIEYNPTNQAEANAFLRNATIEQTPMGNLLKSMNRAKANRKSDK
ncbi:hypothetical protein INT43_005794 [Umbelopsis isabellina]|uniref:Nucleolar complex protein 2 n=1 Tax=Mortierella isabellina TaxID=91625 RepID=A0A8H7PK65_MORIS|nr:hypothetical protein INT43_005794 [Umbelopsis isabellina]